MSRPRAAIALVLAALLAPAAAPAQVVVVGPGSTAGGDALRGAGVFYDGLGNFNRNSAIGRSIDADTMMRWNQYVYECRKEWNRQRLARINARSAASQKAYNEIRRRIRDNPTEGDLMQGDALNVLLEELSSPAIHPSVLRALDVPLRGEAIQLIPFQYASLGGTISMRQLLIRDGWPLPLRSAAFAAEREAYLRAADTVLEQDLRRKLTPEAVKALQAAAARLRDRVERTIPPTDKQFYSQAQDFLKGLDNASRMVGVPVVEAILGEMQRHPGTSVSDLLEFMQRFNLRFAPAVEPSERELYRELYALLLRQRDLLAARGGFARPDPSAPPAAGAPAARR